MGKDCLGDVGEKDEDRMPLASIGYKRMGYIFISFLISEVTVGITYMYHQLERT